MKKVTVQELIDFLSTFNSNDTVLINVDSGTPDPCHLPPTMEKFYTVVDPDGNEEDVGEGLIQDYLDDGFAILKVRPLLWPA